MKRFRRGLVVGKFAPLHRGHQWLIEQALQQCTQVVLLSYCDPEPRGCSALRRQAWLQANFPQAQILVGDRQRWPDMPTEQDPAEQHHAFIAQVLRQADLDPIDAVFTSETYGEPFSRALTRAQGSNAVQHVLGDLERQRVPISATRIRGDIHGQRHWLAPGVYPSFVHRVALLGCESSGKTTLAQALAERMDTVWVPEFGREHWLARAGKLTQADLLHIARTQVQHEQAMLPDANRYLFCDTTPLTTLFYSLDGFGKADSELLQLADRAYDSTLLCAPDFGFVQDGTRPDPTICQRQQPWYLEQLSTRRIPYAMLTGSVDERCRSWHRIASAALAGDY